jgi:YidC/Oxa1 family membrane protein insertase
MANPRIYLWVAVALLLWMNLVQWNRDYGDRPPPAAATTAAPAPSDAQPTAPAEDASLPELPAAPSPQAADSAPAAAAAPLANPGDASPSRVRVVTDVLDIDIDLRGGNLVRADLLTYPHDKQPGSPPVRLLDTREATYNTDRSGLRALNAASEPNHLAQFMSPAREYRLAPGASELRVPLIWTDGA